MTLQFYGNGTLGEVWIEDRRPDGSVVMLVCTPGATRARAAQAGPDPGVGLVHSSAPGGGAYPHLRESDLVRHRTAPVHVDTTELPGGIQRFVMALFGRKALEAAGDGVREVRLTTATARDWGWLGEDGAAPGPVDG